MIILLGPVGAGKSAQAKIIEKRFGYKWLSTGELLRSSKDPIIHEKLKTGKLFDDEDIEKIVDEAITGMNKDQKIVFDGFPRRVTQAKWLDDKLSNWSRKLDAVVHIVVGEEEANRRMKLRGRADDSEEAIKKRHEEYQQNVMPVVEHYKNEGMLSEVDGVGTVEEVSGRIEEALREHGVHPN